LAGFAAPRPAKQKRTSSRAKLDCTNKEGTEVWAKTKERFVTMADITPDFNICLKNKGAQVVLRKEFDVQRISSFLQEAYSIVGRWPDCMECRVST